MFGVDQTVQGYFLTIFTLLFIVLLSTILIEVIGGEYETVFKVYIRMIIG